VANRPFFKTPKLPNEPNLKMPIPPLNTGDFPFSSAFETCKKRVKKCQFRAIFMLFRVGYGALIGQKEMAVLRLWPIIFRRIKLI
jgi:hypothetical protein